MAGLVLFLGIHSISIVNEPLRDRAVARVGEQVWQGLYSVIAIAIAIAGIVLIVCGNGLARHDPMVLH